jgi:hypothetical protein
MCLICEQHLGANNMKILTPIYNIKLDLIDLTKKEAVAIYEIITDFNLQSEWIGLDIRNRTATIVYFESLETLALFQAALKKI